MKKLPIYGTVILCLLVIAESRQMCWTCQYQKPGRGLECITAPGNWTGGESRVKCPTQCIITATYDSTSGEANFFYRGCGESSQKDGCIDSGATHSCYFACEGRDYCNKQSLSRSPLLESLDSSQSTQAFLRPTSNYSVAIASAFALFIIKILM